MLKGVVKSQLSRGMHYDTVVETRVGTTITVKMQVSQDRPVLNADAGEKISASAFLIDVEDVGELDDAKVVALASAEAWDVETEEPISIKNVEYDIKPEVGSYSVTFTTAAGTSITVKAAVMAENRVESKVYQEEIYAMNFFKKVEDIQGEHRARHRSGNVGERVRVVPRGRRAGRDHRCQVRFRPPRPSSRALTT